MFPTWIPALAALSTTLAPLPVDDDSWLTEAAELRSAGALAFGPDGVLFVGDAEGAAVFAFDTGDTTRSEGELNVPELREILGYLTGTGAESIEIQDLAVNPASGKAYLSVTRKTASGSQPALVRVSDTEKIEVLDLAKMRHMRAEFANAPAAGGEGRRNQRAYSITDLEFHDGVLYVAGLSNEEFASKLRMLEFPFGGGDAATSVEIYHAAHGAWETRSPVRTFLPMDIGGEAHLLAAYTCTPLVTFPVAKLAPDEKLVGKTVAELGNRNTPLDMVLYEKDAQGYVLIANTSRGVMKVATSQLKDAAGLTERASGPTGVGYETIETLADVTQLARLTDARALVLVEKDGGAELRVIDLP